MLGGLVALILFLKLGSYKKNIALDILFLSKTRVNRNRILNILPKLSYDFYDFINPIGYSKGLWLCWNFNVFSLDIILKNNRMF